jgi:alkylhydroperoxidase/carboxymuconolactone decarboxylase family protein YurZ
MPEPVPAPVTATQGSVKPPAIEAGRFRPTAHELGIYIKGALGSGVAVEEIQEVLIQAIAYCGAPAGRQAFLAAHRTLSAEGALG